MSIRALQAAMLVPFLSLAQLAAVEIARDGFEAGSLAGPLWIGTTAVSVSTDRAHAGTRSARFRFAGNASLDADAFSELRFDLGAVYPELWVRYRLYVPDNYVHRNATGSDNNKFIRLWGATYNDLEKVGASLWLNSPADGYSSMIMDWNRHGEGIGPKGSDTQGCIANIDRGVWMDVVFHAKAATATTLGTLRIWKNGNLLIDGSGTVDNYTPGEAHGYRYGYLLGWANSGFAVTTDLYIDEVVFGTTRADLDPPVANRAPVAVSGLVEVTAEVARSLTLAASDADGDALSYTVVVPPAHGTLVGSGASRIYTPLAGFVGNDVFTFRVNDGSADSNTAIVTLQVAAADDEAAIGGDDALSARNGTGDGGGCGTGGAIALCALAIGALLPRRREAYTGR